MAKKKSWNNDLTELITDSRRYGVGNGINDVYFFFVFLIFNNI